MIMVNINAVIESLEYVPLADGVLKYLANAKISKLLKSIRVSVLDALQKQQWSYGIDVQLHPLLQNYFSNLSEFSGRFKDFENEPKEIVQIKKILNLWLAIEKTLEAVEHTDALFHVDTAMRFSAIQEQIHGAVRELLELDIEPLSIGSETFSGVDFFCKTALSIKSDIMVAFYGSDEQTQRTINNLHRKLSAYLEHLREPQKLAVDFGFIAGASIDLLSPHDNAKFIGQFISLIPFSMHQMSEQIKYFTQQMLNEQSHISPSKWKHLEKNLELIFDNLANLESNPVYFGAQLTSILFNLRQVYNFYKTFIANIGRMCPETQERFKIELRHLKYDVLLKLKVSLDLFETDLMLAPGTLTENIFPHIENLYHHFMVLMNNVIQFDESDHDIHWFYEKKWYEFLIYEHAQVLARRKTEVLLSKDKIETFSMFLENGHVWSSAEITNVFGLFGALLSKIDAKLFNKMHYKICEELSHLDEVLPLSFRDEQHMDAVLEADDLILRNYVNRVFNTQERICYENAAQSLRREIRRDYQDIIHEFRSSPVVEKVRQALFQECASWEFREKISESSIQYIQHQSQHYAYVIKIQKSIPSIEYDEIRHRFNGFYGLIGVVVQPNDIYENANEGRADISAWYWVDKCHKTIRECEEATILQQIKNRPLIVDAPQKLIAQEILGLKRMGLGECLYQIKGSGNIQRDDMLVVNIPDHAGEQELKQVLIKCQLTLNNWEQSRKAGCEFFNILARIQQKNKKISSLSNEQKIRLLNFLNQFEFLIRDNDEVICGQLFTGLNVRKPEISDLTIEQLIALKPTWLEHMARKILTQKMIIQYVGVRFKSSYGRNAANQLMHVERDDYFLQNTHHSKFFAGLQDLFKQILVSGPEDDVANPLAPEEDFLQNSPHAEFFIGFRNFLKPFFGIYTPTIRDLFMAPQGHIYKNLHEPDLILLEPQQVVEQKLLFNVLGQIKAFCENLESYRISDFDQNYLKLHLDIIVGYLNFNNLSFFYFKTEHHFDLLKQLINLLTSRWNYLTEKKDYYGPTEVELIDEVKQFENLHQWIHCLFSLPPIINNLNEPVSLSQAQLRDMSQEYLKVSQKVIDVLVHTNSFWWILWHIPRIKQLIVQIKDKFQEACHALHSKTIDNLFDLKLVLFKDLILECDEIELDLGFKSELFSDQVHLLIDILFEHLLGPLDLDLSKFAKLVLSNDLYSARLRGLHALENQLISKKSSLSAELRDIQQFDIHPSIYQFEKILPLLVKYNQCRSFPPVGAKPGDHKFRAWIKHIRQQNINLSRTFDEQNVDFSSVYYNSIPELIHFVHNALQGLIATEELKIQCCREKIQHIVNKQQTLVEEKPQKIKDIIHAKLSYCFNQMADHFNEFRPEILNAYRRFMLTHLEAQRAGFEEQLFPVLEANMERITHIRSTEALFEGEANTLCYDLINECILDFVDNHYANYCYLNDVFIAIEKFEAHLKNQSTLLAQGHFLWFENEDSLNTKLTCLNMMKTFLIDDDGPVLQRLAAIQATINDEGFQSIISTYAYVPNLSFTLLVEYFWAFMSYLGLYQSETQILFKNLELVMNPHEVQTPQLEKYGLFAQKDLSYQNNIIEGIRLELMN